MSNYMVGYIGLYRKLAESDLWLSEKFSRGQAWVDLLLLARFKPGFIRVAGVRIDLNRGDVGWSENALASRWRWSRTKVRGFISELEEDERIVKKTSKIKDKRKSIVTISNYEQYQDLSGETKASDCTIEEQEKDNRKASDCTIEDTGKKKVEEGKEGKEGKKKTTAASCPDNDSGDDDGGSGESPAKKKTPLQLVKEMRPDWWSIEEWDELIAHRRSLKTVLSKRAYGMLIKDFNAARAAGETPQSILDDMCSGKGWAGYKLEWVENRRSGSQHTNGMGAVSPFKIDQKKPVENWLE